MRFPLSWRVLRSFVACCGLLSGLWLSSAYADQLIMRNGVSLTGQLQRAASDYILIIPSKPPQRVPRQEIRSVVYDDPTIIARELKLQQTAMTLGCSRDLKQVRVLPAQAFGQAICEAARTARESIYISQFLISGAQAEDISKFYTALKACGNSGLKVVVIAEYGPRTPADVKFKSFEFGKELEGAGVTTLYHRTAKVLHKKIMLVDGIKVILGSSNLTLAGVAENNEMNFMVEDEQLAKEVMNDINKLIAESLTREQVFKKELNIEKNQNRKERYE